MEKALRIKNVSAGYAGHAVLKDVSFDVEQGSFVAIVGANGAGKTTLLKTLIGLVPSMSGSVELFAEDLSSIECHNRIHAGLVLVPEGRQIFPKLTVEQNLQLGAFIMKDKVRIQQNLEKIYALFPILAERRAQSGGSLSGGEQQMLALGRALISDPKMVLLDEPSMGIAPKVTQKIFETLKSLNKQGVTLLVVEQKAHEILALADQAHVLELGQLTLSGTGQELLHHPEVINAYLGES